MKQRLQKVSRLLKVQQHLHKSAELKLAALQHEAMELKNAQEAIIQTMNDHETLYGLFIDVTAKRLQTLAGQAKRVDDAKTAQASLTFDKAMEAKRTEKLVLGLEEQARREGEKKDLQSILELISAKSSTSFP